MSYISKPDFSRSISSGKMGELVIVGAGVSTLFGVIHLIDNGYNPKSIRIIERGPSIEDPKRKNNILSGFGGAGAYSDFKCIFSKHQDTSVVEKFGLEVIEEDHEFIKSTIERFHPNPSSIGKTYPNKELEDLSSLSSLSSLSGSVEGWGDVSIAQSESWHIGTTEALGFLKNVEKYLIDQGVEILFNTTLVGILDKYGKYVTSPTEEFEKYNSPRTVKEIEDMKERKKLIRREIKSLKMEGKYLDIGSLEKEIESIKYRLNVLKPTETEKYYYHLILALGKTGKKFLDSYLEKKNIRTKKNVAQIGVRFETPFNDKIKDIASKQYDFKFVKTYKEKGEYISSRLRTFCVNHESAYVAIEEVDDFAPRKQSNGHAYGFDSPHRNDLSNWGIIAEVELKSSNSSVDADSYIENILKKMKFQLKVVDGDEMNFESSVEVSQDSICSKEDFLRYYRSLGFDILDFIKTLSGPLGYNENWRIFIPEIKISSGKIPSKDSFRLDEFPNIFCIGDLSNLQTRGIVPAASHFIEMSKNLLRKKGKDL